LVTGSGRDRIGQKGDVRFIGDVPGCFVLPDRTDGQAEPQIFSFVARSVATSRSVLSADVAVERGERVALNFIGIGVRRGIVERVLKGGFIVAFTEADGTGEDIAARIEWLNRKTRGRAEDRRAHQRVTPKNASALLILGAESTMECRVKDMSVSGAAILAPVEPAIGSLLAIGAVPGRVVRHFEGGFAVRFLEPQDLAELEGLLTLSSKREKSLAARKLGFAA
jgi:hypothetical protein